MKTASAFLLCLLLMASCSGPGRKANNLQNDNVMITDTLKQYGYNRDFLKKHTDIVELTNGNAAIVIVPGWQGRVMTSTSSGDKGFSYGWINHDLISSGEIQAHINAFGGEERFRE